MTVRFAREGNRCVVTAWTRERRPFPVSGMVATDLPHDLSTFVVERELGLAGGFVNLVAHGATFRSSGRRHTRPGRDVIVANRAALDEAEATVHRYEDAWRRGDDGLVSRALSRARQQWADVGDGESLELTWARLPLPTRPVRRDRSSAGLRRRG